MELKERHHVAVGGERHRGGGEQGGQEGGGGEERPWRWEIVCDVLLCRPGHRIDLGQGEKTGGKDCRSTGEKGEKESREGEEKRSKDRAKAEAKTKGGIKEGVDGCRASWVGCQEDRQDGRPEHCHAHPLEEPDQVGGEQEQAEV